MTNDVCTTLRGKWLEVSISLEMLSDGKSRMRFGVGAEGLPRKYKYADFAFPTGQNIPAAGKLYLAGITGTGSAFTSCAPARGSYHMIAYWERTLTDDEILAAFKMEGPDGTAAQDPALLKIGDPAWSDDVFGNAISGTSATPSLDFQDLGKVPLLLAAGQTLNLPFTVPETCTNLRQVVRIATATGTGALQVAIDGAAAQVADAIAGKTACVAFDGVAFTGGQHVLGLTRCDAGTDPLKLEKIEVSGSWRLGWIDGKATEFGGDSGKKRFAVTNLTANAWPALRSTVKATQHLELAADLNAEDVAKRRFVLLAKPTSYPAQKFDYVILANGKEVFRRIFSPDKPYSDERPKLINVSFRPGELLAGENVFTFKTEINESLDPDPASTWVQHDYFALEVGTEPTGGCLIVK